MKKIIAWLGRHPYTSLAILITLVSAVMVWALIVKYQHFGYNAMDLGIYNQVFYNTVHGRLFQFSVHPHSYLGDHFEIFILALAPLYALKPSPATLLILQALGLTLAAWPLFLIAKKYLPAHFALAMAAAWLLNPFLWNMAFFEFHLLPFAVILLLSAYYFYDQKKFTPFLLCSLLALTVREDVALAVIMFGALAALDRRPLRWILAPVIAGGLWFIIAMQLTGYFNGYGSYKFLLMYPWLGGSFSSAIKTLALKPWLILTHLFTFNNLWLLCGLLLPMAGLYLLKPRALLLTLLVALQLFLTGLNPTVVLETHYTALLLPGIFIAAIISLAYLIAPNQPETAKKRLFFRYRWRYGVIIIGAIVYSFAIISPITAMARSLFQSPWNSTVTHTAQQSVNQTSPDESVAVGYNFLTPLSSREHIYSLNYAFLGKKQYSEQDYELPTSVQRIILDARDFIIYQLQYSDSEQYAGGAERIRAYLDTNGFVIESVDDSIVTFTKGQADALSLYSVSPDAPTDIIALHRQITPTLEFVGWKKMNTLPIDSNHISLSLVWRLSQTAADDFHLEFSVSGDNGKNIFETILPFGYGLFPVFDWPAGTYVTTNFWLTVPSSVHTSNSQLNLEAVETAGYLDLDGWRSAKIVYTKKQAVGPGISIDYWTR